MCENSKVVIYLVLSHDKIRGENSVPTLRMKRVDLQGQYTHWMNNFKFGQEIFWKNRFMSFVKIQGSKFLQIVSQAKISKFLWSGGKKEKPVKGKALPESFVLPCPCGFPQPLWPLFFSILTKFRCFLHFLNNQITIKYFQSASDTFQKEVEILFQHGREIPLQSILSSDYK